MVNEHICGDSMYLLLKAVNPWIYVLSLITVSISQINKFAPYVISANMNIYSMNHFA